MLASNQDIPKDNIVLEVKNAFQRITNLKNPMIVDIINALNPELFKGDGYREIDFSYNSLCKCLLLKRLKGIRFQTGLVIYLKTHKRDRRKLDLKRTPDQTTISYFLTHILDDETKDRIESIAKAIESLAPTYGIFLDVKAMKPEKPKKETKTRNQFLQKRDKTSEVCKMFKKQFMAFIDFKLKHNVVYRKNQFIDLLVHMGLTQDFAETGSKTIGEELAHKRMFCPMCHTPIYPVTVQHENKNEIRIFRCGPCGYEKRISPDADTLLYHLKQFPTYNEVHKMFTTASEKIWETARKANLFDTRTRYDVAIDFTEWYFYGDRNAPMVVGKEPDKGTSWCYKFATIDIVESGKRFTLLSLPFGHFNTKTEILRKLLTYALERIKISRVYADRGFCDSNSIKVFNNFQLRYITPCTQYSTVKRILEITPTPTIIKDFPMKDVTFTLVILQETNKRGEVTKHAYATNERFEENDMHLAEQLSDLYANRWGIETGYRVKKHSFLSKTKSKNYLIRLFYLMFSVLMYNLWILADILIWLALFGIVKEHHLVTSKYFGTVFYIIDDPGG
jgi:hypothetical protein